VRNNRFGPKKEMACIAFSRIHLLQELLSDPVIERPITKFR
jgi:hypothetical protein